MRDAFCSYCGSAFDADARKGYPRACADCRRTTWANPIPVCVVLVPVEQDGATGLLVIRRGIDPGRGRLALVGGFLEEHETWQAGAAREVREETGLEIDPTSLEPFYFTSTEPPNRVLLFSIAAPVRAREVAPFTPNAETLDRGVVFGTEGLDALFAFPLHLEAATRYFAARGNATPDASGRPGAGPHRFAPL